MAQNIHRTDRQKSSTGKFNHASPKANRNANPPLNIPRDIIASLKAAGLKLTPPRLTILQQLLLANQDNDHSITPESLHQKIATRHKRAISLATIYRTLKVFEEKKIILRHDFHNQRPHYEINAKSHHDHLIDLTSGKVIEFYDKELEMLQEKIITRLGYKIIDHRLEIYAKPIKKNNQS